jgi:hypothetical protein
MIKKMGGAADYKGLWGFPRAAGGPVVAPGASGRCYAPVTCFDCVANSMYNHAFSRTVRGKIAKKQATNRLMPRSQGFCQGAVGKDGL